MRDFNLYKYYLDIIFFYLSPHYMNLMLLLKFICFSLLRMHILIIQSWEAHVSINIVNIQVSIVQHPAIPVKQSARAVDCVISGGTVVSRSQFLSILLWGK